MTDKKKSSKPCVGVSVPRLDGDQKVRGQARYVDDLLIPDCWVAQLVRSTVSHGKLLGLKKDPSFDWSQVVVVTPEDIPGPNEFVMHDRSMPVLAEDEIMYAGEPLAIVAAPTRELAREAAQHIQADIDELPAVTTLEELIAQYKEKDPSAVTLSAQTIVKGDVDQALADADLVVEQEYTAGYQEQLYIEPQGMVAIPQSDGGVFVQGSMQCPYYVVHEAREALGLKPEQLRVKQAVVGGAFGGKEEYPSQMAAYCALPAMKSGHPVKLVYDRHEDILFTTKRHPCWVRLKTGLRKDGTILGIKVDYLLNGGAYLTLSDVVMFRGILHAAMGYKCDHVFVNGVVLRTHVFPSGAFRGFGAPQAIWALESHVDELAAAVHMTPHEFRCQNCLQKGDRTPTGQVLKDSVGSPAVLERALAQADFSEKWARCSHGEEGLDTWYGIGLSFFAHGAAFTGDGEARIKSRVALDLEIDSNDRPIALARVSSTEMGQGSSTVLPQITADALSVGLEYVRCPLPDTGVVPNSGPTVASRTTMIVGSCLHQAALKMKTLLESSVSELLAEGKPVSLCNSLFTGGGCSWSFEEAARKVLAEQGPLRTEHQFDLPPGIVWNQETFEGDAYPGYAWGCNIAEVEVDPLTLEIKVPKVTACFDIGKVINPVLAKGQVEGGLTQALGYAVMEKMGVRNGYVDADRMQTYVIPTMLDAPEYDITFAEFPYEQAAPGAKGVGEIPMNGLAPAIANAIEAAVGVRIRELPITPEKILDALQKDGMHE